MMRLSALTATLVAAALLAACGKSEPPPPPPPPPKAEAPQAAAPDVDAATKRLASEVYVFAYPMVLTDLSREAARDGVNTFMHQRTMPDATATSANPNADFLYSRAWLDLSKEPIILSVPDSRGRYFLVAMLDAYTNVASSIGRRTTGTEKREFAIVGPHWKGTLPADVTEIRSPTELAWLFGRIEVRNKADLAAATRFQEQITVAPLSARGKRNAKPPAPAKAEGADPRAQIAAMDATTFFTRVAALLPGNPPTKDDAPMQEKIAKLGIKPGQPFDTAKLDPLQARSIEDAVKTTLPVVEAAARSNSGIDIKNGWGSDRILGRWGTDYGKRVVAAWRGLGVNAPEDALVMTAHLDGAGKKLDGANTYVLHFDKDTTPPTEAFWSLSLYDDKQHFFGNPLARFNLGSNDKLQKNADGSIDIYVQNANPGKDKEANWLPAPAGPFTLTLRIYWPRQEVVDGRWNAPGIKRVT